MSGKIGSAKICFVVLFGIVLGYSMPGISRSQREVVDRIVALVNEEVITLTDVRIVKTFNLFSYEKKPDADINIEYVLHKLIDQKLIIQMTQEDPFLQSSTVDESIDQIMTEMGVIEFRKRLKQFGMNRTDLVPYVSRWVMCQRIIADRFKTSIPITLEEIERYYEETYIPEQESEGLEVKPMLEILDEIEAVIKKQKSKMQVEEWLNNLRERADIQINL